MVKETRLTVYSFDVFDTVLTRAVGSPRAVFLILGLRLVQCGIIPLSAVEFYHARILAEGRAYKNYAPVSQPTLAEIYLQLQYDLGLSVEAAQQIQQTEMALEKELIRVVPKMVTKIHDARQAGERIIFVSDMYLPGVFLEEILREKNFFYEGDKLYVSCEHNASKVTGELFKKILKSEQIAPREMIHCGNDKLADVQMPQRLGIRTDPFWKANLNRYENIMETLSCETMGRASLMAGASRLSRLNVWAQERDKPSIVSVSAGVVAPILTSYVWWILKQAQDKKLQRLYFVSRDGQVLLEIARALQIKLKMHLDLRYLYGGRQAWHLPALSKFGTMELGWMLDELWENTLISLLKRVDIDSDSIQSLLRKHAISKSDLSRSMTRRLEKKIKKLFADQELERLVLERANRKKSIVSEYFKQEGVFDEIPYGVVDLGWKGHLQRSFSNILAQSGKKPPPPWFFFGVVKEYVQPHSNACHTYMFNAFTKLGEVNLAATAITKMEMFCMADHELVTGYVATAGVITPCFLETRKAADDRLSLSLLRRTILSFVDSLSIDERMMTATGCREVAVGLLAEFQEAPTRAEAAAWGGVLFNHDQAGMHSFKIARRLELKDVLDILLFGRVKASGFAAWPQAFYNLTPAHTLFFIKAANLITRHIRSRVVKVVRCCQLKGADVPSPSPIAIQSQH